MAVEPKATNAPRFRRRRERTWTDRTSFTSDGHRGGSIRRLSSGPGFAGAHRGVGAFDHQRKRLQRRAGHGRIRDQRGRAEHAHRTGQTGPLVWIHGAGHHPGEGRGGHQVPAPLEDGRRAAADAARHDGTQSRGQRAGQGKMELHSRRRDRASHLEERERERKFTMHHRLIDITDKKKRSNPSSGA